MLAIHGCTPLLIVLRKISVCGVVLCLFKEDLRYTDGICLVFSDSWMYATDSQTGQAKSSVLWRRTYESVRKYSVCSLTARDKCFRNKGKSVRLANSSSVSLVVLFKSLVVELLSENQLLLLHIFFNNLCWVLSIIYIIKANMENKF